MRRAAWINQILAAWLIAYLVFGLPDSSSALEIAAHGAIAVLLLLASWRVITKQVGATVPAALQVAAGAALASLPAFFAYPLSSFAARHDLVLGVAVLIDGLIEVWPHRRSTSTSA